MVEISVSITGMHKEKTNQSGEMKNKDTEHTERREKRYNWEYDAYCITHLHLYMKSFS